MSNEGRPEGFYKGRAIAGSEQYATASNGNEQIAIDVEVPSLNRSFTTFLHFTDAAAPYAIERLRACGWSGNDLSKLVGVDANEIDISIKYETYQGKERMKVDIATGGGRVKLENQMDDRQKRAFAARMHGFMKGTGATQQQQQQQTMAQQRPAQQQQQQQQQRQPAQQQPFGQRANGSSPPPARQQQQQEPDPFGAGQGGDFGDPGGDEIPFISSVDRTPRHLRLRSLWSKF